MILATQNPLESYGTYPLPESQLDRFMMSVTIGYPSIRDEKAAVVSQGRETRVEDVKPIMNMTELELLQQQVDHIHVHEDVMDYLLRLVDATRHSRHIRLGVSTRGAIFLRRAAQAAALMDGRSYVTPDDVKGLVLPVFTHRVILASASLTERDRVVETSHVLNDIIESQTIPY
jgi:MoxR-like ATPase